MGVKEQWPAASPLPLCSFCPSRPRPGLLSPGLSDWTSFWARPGQFSFYIKTAPASSTEMSRGEEGTQPGPRGLSEWQEHSLRQGVTLPNLPPAGSRDACSPRPTGPKKPCPERPP